MSTPELTKEDMRRLLSVVVMRVAHIEVHIPEDKWEVYHHSHLQELENKLRQIVDKGGSHESVSSGGYGQS